MIPIKNRVKSIDNSTGFFVFTCARAVLNFEDMYLISQRQGTNDS